MSTSTVHGFLATAAFLIACWYAIDILSNRPAIEKGVFFLLMACYFVLRQVASKDPTCER